MLIFAMRQHGWFSIAETTHDWEKPLVAMQAQEEERFGQKKTTFRLGPQVRERRRCAYGNTWAVRHDHIIRAAEPKASARPG